MTSPPITPRIAALPATVPFVGPDALMRRSGRAFRTRLGANESVFGPSPRALAAMREAVAGSWMYADPESFELEHAIARHHGIEAASVVAGEGIDGLLGLTLQIAIERGDTVVTSDGAYPTFNFHVAAQGGRLVKVPFRADREDLPRLVETARRERARVLYISNPNNPMGSWWPAGAVQEAIDGLPPGVLLVLDEAYSDTAPADAVPVLDVANPQVLRYRTFSKAYGLAGARVGYALGHPALIQSFEKVRNHYGMNRTGQIGALAALADQNHLAGAVAAIASSREAIARIASDSGLLALPSATNFVAVDCGRDGAFAQRVLDEVLARDVFIRKPGVPPLDRCIRISCGREADLATLAEALREAVRAAETRPT